MPTQERHLSYISSFNFFSPDGNLPSGLLHSPGQDCIKLFRVMKMKQELKLKHLLPAIALPLAVGGLAAFLTKDSMMLYQTMPKPPLSPPGWVFPVVWTILYVLMGIASALVWTAGVSPVRRDRALTVYLMSLGANFIWPLIFFGMELYLLAFIWLIVLWLLSAATLLLFWYISEAAGKLMLPYLLWLSFAAYLNLGVWLINP